MRTRVILIIVRVVFVVSLLLGTVDVPLHRAQENPMLAKAGREQGRNSDVQVLFAEVVDSLKTQQWCATTKRAMDGIVEEISTFSQGPDNKKPDKAFGGTIDGWWDRIAALTR